MTDLSATTNTPECLMNVAEHFTIRTERIISGVNRRLLGKFFGPITVEHQFILAQWKKAYFASNFRGRNCHLINNNVAHHDMHTETVTDD
jgi:hypothetical protein